MHQILFNYLKKPKIDINHGWHHYWDEPFEQKQFLKEYVKGPFTKTVLMFSDPYVTLHKQDRNGSPVKIKEGIPDPWAEYLIFNFLLHDNNLRSSKMYKEDLNVVNALRKRYRLYLGQGIPDPCLIHPYIISPELAKSHFLLSKGGRCDCNSQNKNFNLKNCKKKHCFCCEKKYLFECPDKWDGNLNRLKCSCPNCHRQNWEDPDDSELCEVCTRVHYYDDTELPKTIKSIKNQSVSLDTRPDSNKISSKAEETPKEPPKIDATESQTRKNAEFNVQVDAAKLSGNQQMIAKTNPSERTFTVQSSERKMRICCCPYIKGSKHRKANDFPKKQNPVGVQETQIPSVVMAVATSTKEIQTDPTKYSKQVQTNQSSRKLCRSISCDRNCECISKCPYCCLIQCRKPFQKCPNTIQPFSDDIIQFQKCPLNKEHHSHCSSCCVNVLRSMLEAKTLDKMQNRNCMEKHHIKYKKERRSNSLQNNSKMKANGKLYCCTFSSGFSGKCKNHLSKPFSDKSDKFDKESFKKAANNRFVYNCTPNSVSSKMADYLSTKTFNLNPSTHKPSFYYELKPASNNLMSLRFPFETQPDDGLKNFRSFQKSNRMKTLLTPAEIPETENNASRKETNAPVPLEVKYVNDLKSDESKTYGLINSKKRRKGRKLRSIVYKKTISKNSKPQIFKASHKLKKCQKIVNAESCELSLHQVKDRKGEK